MFRKLLFIVSMLLVGCNHKVQPIGPPHTPAHWIETEGSVRFEADVTWGANSLNTRVWAQNEGSEPAQVRTGQCAAQVLAYTSQSEDRELIWYSAPAGPRACHDALYVLDLEPGQRKHIERLAGISGDEWQYDMPAGTWYFEVRFPRNVRLDSFLTIPAGYVAVRR